MKTTLALLGLLAGAACAAAEGSPAGPLARLVLHGRQGKAVPVRQGFTHTGSGNIDVSQPAPDVVVVTFAGVAVAGGHPCKGSLASLAFEVEQCFEVEFDPGTVKSVRLSAEARLVGLLRSHAKCGGTAQAARGHATVGAGGAALLTLSTPAHAVAAGENLSVNDRVGPESVPVAPGRYVLHQTFAVTAAHPRSLLPCKAASAEFAPDPALDPLWISAYEPFRGAQKKEFGLQVTLRVVAEEAEAKKP